MDFRKNFSSLPYIAFSETTFWLFWALKLIRVNDSYDDDNWYILYALAIELDLSIDDPSDEQVEWIEEDIKKTLAKISAIANLTAWHWYVGDEEAKKNALKYYFHQIYGLEFPDLNH